jgi:hypothetical protein
VEQRRVVVGGREIGVGVPDDEDERCASPVGVLPDCVHGVIDRRDGHRDRRTTGQCRVERGSRRNAGIASGRNGDSTRRAGRELRSREGARDPQPRDSRLGGDEPIGGQHGAQVARRPRGVERDLGVRVSGLGDGRQARVEVVLGRIAGGDEVTGAVTELGRCDLDHRRQ